MNPLYRVWWRLLMDLRPTVRYLAERLPKLAPWAVRLRVVLHTIVGHPIQSVAVFDGLLLWKLFGWPGRPVLAGVLALVVVMEIYHRVGFKSGGWLIG